MRCGEQLQKADLQPNKVDQQRYMAIEAGPLDPFNHSFSIIVECDDQAEIDRLWDALKEGGSVEQCGWLRDRWGLCWQITPKRLGELMRDPQSDKAKRVAEAVLCRGTSLTSPTVLIVSVLRRQVPSISS